MVQTDTRQETIPRACSVPHLLKKENPGHGLHSKNDKRYAYTMVYFASHPKRGGFFQGNLTSTSAGGIPPSENEFRGGGKSFAFFTRQQNIAFPRAYPGTDLLFHSLSLLSHDLLRPSTSCKLGRGCGDQPEGVGWKWGKS